MEWDLIISNVFQVCIIPLLAMLTTYLVQLIKTKSDQISSELKNNNQDLAAKYLGMIAETVSDCVIATNQTYVESLKAQGTFDENAQKVAFEKTLNAVLAVLSEDVKDYLKETFGDLQTYLTIQIESQVKKNK